MKKNKKIIITIAHLATWICFFLLPYIFFPQSKDIPFDISKYIIILLIIINLFLLGFYYLNKLILIPLLLFKRKWLLYLLCVIACFVAFFYVPKEVAHWITGNDEETIRQEIAQQHRAEREKAKLLPADSSKQSAINHRPPIYKRNSDFRYFPGSYAVFILVFAVGTCLSVMTEWKKTEDHKEQIEREKINTELSFLKSQINPHFFFNTLNNIYSLAITGSAQTANAVMKLSSIMRYVLTDTQNNSVSLQSEVDFIKNYIELQQVRLTDKVKVDFITEGDLENKQIAPLLFIPFIENAFKYGISTKDASAIEIKLFAKTKSVSFSVINRIVKAENAIKDTTGIGINNVKRRLELLYPQKHKLEVAENNNQFIVHLDIDLV